MSRNNHTNNDNKLNVGTLQALKTDQEVRDILQSSTIMRPMLKKKTFEKQFSELDTENANRVSLKEFMKFCESSARVMEESSHMYKVPVVGHKYTRPVPKSIDEMRIEANKEHTYRREETPRL